MLGKTCSWYSLCAHRAFFKVTISLESTVCLKILDCLWHVRNTSCKVEMGYTFIVPKFSLFSLQMSKQKSVYPKDPKTELKAIKYYSDYQLPWNILIPRLREYSIQL